MNRNSFEIGSPEFAAIATFRMYMQFGLGRFDNWLSMRRDDISRERVVQALRYPHVLEYAKEILAQRMRCFDELSQLIREAESLKPFPVNNETQQSVHQWAVSAFGEKSSNLRVAERAQEEMDELRQKLMADDNHTGAGEEVADTVIVLMRLAEELGIDLQKMINEKMAVNRERTWKPDGTGMVYHVGESTATPTQVTSNETQVPKD